MQDGFLAASPEERLSLLEKITDQFEKRDAFNPGYDGAYHYDTTPMDTGNKNPDTDYRYEPLARATLQYLDERREPAVVVDFGCGVGWFVEHIKRTRPRHYPFGLEYSQVCVDRMKRKGLPCGRMDINSIPDEITGVVDVGFSRGVLMSADDPLNALRKIMNTIASSGVFFFSICTGIWWHRLVQRYMHPPLMKMCETKPGLWIVKYLFAGSCMPLYWVMSRLRSGKGITFDETFNQFSDLFLNKRVEFLDWYGIVNRISSESNQKWRMSEIGKDIYGAMVVYRLQRETTASGPS